MRADCWWRSGNRVCTVSSSLEKEKQTTDVPSYPIFLWRRLEEENTVWLRSASWAAAFDYWKSCLEQSQLLLDPPDSVTQRKKDFFPVKIHCLSPVVNGYREIWQGKRARGDIVYIYDLGRENPLSERLEKLLIVLMMKRSGRDKRHSKQRALLSASAIKCAGYIGAAKDG